MPFFDNNVLQCFGAAGALPFLRRFQPARVTHRVAQEQRRTAPERARAQFDAALREGWLTLHGPAARVDIIAAQEAVRGLSATDAELLLLATARGEDLFTDENLLARAAEARGVVVYDVVDTLLLLVELGDLDRAKLRAVVMGIHLEDGRKFTPSELDALDLKGLF